MIQKTPAKAGGTSRTCQKNKNLISFALEDENVIYTGIGKLSASYHILKAISLHKPDMIINLGSAGSNVFPTKTLVNCTSFIQRDMNAVPLGFDKWVTPFSNEAALLKYGNRISNLPEAVCGTGDSFDISDNYDIYNVVDMEGYALAKICQLEKIPFICIKYISDGADGKAAEDWHDSVSDSAAELYDIYKQIV